MRLDLVGLLLGILAGAIPLSKRSEDGSVVYRGHEIDTNSISDSRYDDKWDVEPYQPSQGAHCHSMPEAESYRRHLTLDYREKFHGFNDLGKLVTRATAFSKEVLSSQESKLNAIFVKFTSLVKDQPQLSDYLYEVNFFYSKAREAARDAHSDLIDELIAINLSSSERAIELIRTKPDLSPSDSREFNPQVQLLDEVYLTSQDTLATEFSHFSSKFSSWYLKKFDEPYLRDREARKMKQAEKEEEERIKKAEEEENEKNLARYMVVYEL